VLWWSNHPTAPTGYGQQTAIWCRKLRDEGHDVVISSNFGGEPRAHHWDEIPVLPPGEDPFAQDSLAQDCQSVQPDVTFGLYDAWPLKARLEGRVGWWTPVDHSPLPPKVRTALVESGAVPVAMSEWGRDQLAGNGFVPLYTPHGIDTDVYQPRDKAEARRRLNLPADVFLVGMVAANKGQTHLRKGFDVAFQSFAWLAERRSDVHMYVHSRPNSPAGIDLRVVASNYQVPEQSVTFANPLLLRVGISDLAMSWIYSAFDVLLAPSLGEGFGIPVIEAQACGVPVIVTDATAQSELCGAGWKVRGHYLYDSTQAADWVRPYDFLLKQAIEEASDTAAEAAQGAREFALAYDYRAVWDSHFRGVLDGLVPSTEPIVVP
jgi:glycosyltransferase involved in cell wall biosynthesis